MPNRADHEETGLSINKPVRKDDESDTYWNTRFLTHSILGKHYRTPQYNLELLQEFLNTTFPSSNQIIKTKFRATDNENLRFHFQTGVIGFNAHEPISEQEFYNAFNIKTKII